MKIDLSRFIALTPVGGTGSDAATAFVFFEPNGFRGRTNSLPPQHDPAERAQ